MKAINKKELLFNAILSSSLIYIIFLILIVLFRKSCSTTLQQNGFNAIYLSVASMAYIFSGFARKHLFSMLRHGATPEKGDLLIKELKELKSRYVALWIINFLTMIIWATIFNPVCFSFR
jgi:hypothetical protein